MFDRWYIAWRDALNDIVYQFEGADWAYVLALLMPFLCFADFPRYIFGPLVLLIRQLCGLRQHHEKEKTLFLKSKPKVSICISGHNMGDTIDACVRSLIECDYDNKEIIIINDHSSDNTMQVLQTYIDSGSAQVFTSTQTSGNAATANMASHYASGEIIIFADPTMTFDRKTVFHLAGSFYDKKIGVVSGNIKVRNPEQNYLCLLQGAEYLLSIGAWKEALNTFSLNYLASGSLVAFRKEALDAVGGWDPGLATDANLSLKIKRCGYVMMFAPLAIAMCSVSGSPQELARERLWWDRGLLRTYTNWQSGMWKYWLFRWRNLVEMLQEVLFSIIGNLAFVLFAVYLLWLDPWHLLLVYGSSMLAFMLATAGGLGVTLLLSERRLSERRYLWSLPLMPLYKEALRWIRIVAFVRELLKPGEAVPHSSEKSWAYTRKW